MIVTTIVMVAATVLVLNVGASALGGANGGAGAQVQSSSPSSSAKASTSPSPADTCTPGPDPLCIPGDESSSPSSSTSPSASTSPTPGGGDTEKSKISIDYSNKSDSFKGRVDSVNSCEKGRRVDLFKVSPGKDTNLGHGVTAKRGKYTIPYPRANGRFYTKVKKSTPSRNLTCKGAQSKTISV